MLIGVLLIVGGTVIFLRDWGTIVPPAASATLAFLVGLGMLWAAFRPAGLDSADAVETPQASQQPETPYDRAALARLQEAFDNDSKPSDGVSQ